MSYDMCIRYGSSDVCSADLEIGTLDGAVGDVSTAVAGAARTFQRQAGDEEDVEFGGVPVDEGLGRDWYRPVEEKDSAVAFDCEPGLDHVRPLVDRQAKAG